MSIIQNKPYLSKLFIISCFLLGSCTKSFRSQFANKIDWIPKHSYALTPETGIAPVLSDKIPLVLTINFDKEWNKSNKPPRLDPWEDYSVNEEMIDFLVKDIRVEGGSGELFYRTEIDGTSSLGEPFGSGSKVKHGRTKLYYVPDIKDDCNTHKISLVATILTVDYDREAGKSVTCSLKLSEPSYLLEARTDVKVFYVEDKGGTPININITSDNSLASCQKYRLVKWCVTDGKGTMYVDTGSCKKPICSNEPLKFGSNTLFYAPKSGSDGTHTIHLTVGNTKGDTTQDYSFSVKVQDHRIENFTAELSMASEAVPLLPFKDRVCKLKIHPLTDAGRVIGYRVKSIKMNGGKFILGKNAVKEGSNLTVGVNALILNPSGSVGDLTPSIIIVNDKGDEREVTLKQPFVVKDPSFKVVGSLEGSVENGIDNRHINLRVIAPFNTTSDKFILSNYRLSGGIVGDLLKITGKPIELDCMLSVGDSAFKFRLADIDQFIDKIDGAPKLYFGITYPDGTHHETEPVGLSIFLFEALASKINSLSEDGKALYKPIVQDYSLNPASALKNLQDIEPDWYNRQSTLHNILVYMQHDTAISPQAADALANLQTLKSNTKDKVKTRVLMTNLLYDWHKEINRIHANQEPDGRRIHTEILEKEVGDFSDIFRSCRDIPGMEDVVQSLEDVLGKIEKLKIETARLDIKKSVKEAEYKDFQIETRSAMKDERETRASDIKRLEREIKGVCESRDELERNIKSKCSDLQSQLQEKSSTLDDVARRILPLEAFNAERKWYKKTHIPGDEHPYEIAQSMIKKNCYSVEEIVRLSAVPKEKVEDLMKPSRNQIYGWGKEWKKYSDERERELLKKNLS